MAYVPVPKDLTKIKTKVIFNLTKRQLIFFSLGALVGVPIFFLLKPYLNISAAALAASIHPFVPHAHKRIERMDTNENNQSQRLLPILQQGQLYRASR